MVRPRQFSHNLVNPFLLPEPLFRTPPSRKKIMMAKTHFLKDRFFDIFYNFKEIYKNNENPLLSEKHVLSSNFGLFPEFGFRGWKVAFFVIPIRFSNLVFPLVNPWVLFLNLYFLFFSFFLCLSVFFVILFLFFVFYVSIFINLSVYSLLLSLPRARV
jgi:hypothetical protein